MRYLSANQFEVYEEIGKGGFGTVYRGLDRVTKEQVAIKLIDLEDKDYIDDFQKEIKILSQCKLDQITRYLGCFVKGYKLWIIMEYLDGGSCFDLLAPGPIKEKYVAVLLRELLIALSYLHQNSRIHRDIKSANILLNSNGDVKIADFGVSAQLSNNLSKRNTFVGSPYWMAPEIILEEDYNFKADIWSLGITAIELATCKPPLSKIPPMKALFLIPKNEPPTLEGNEFSKDFKDFVHLCLQVNPNDRPSAKRLLETKFISKAGKNSILIDLIKRKDIWELQKNDNKLNPIKNYYVPTLKDPTVDSKRITFDFDDEEKSNSTSEVIATKETNTSYLQENTNILNTLQKDSIIRKNNSTDLSTLEIKRHKPSRILDPKEEFDLIFNNALNKVHVNDNELENLNNIKRSFESLEDDTLMEFLTHLTRNIQSSKLLKNTNSVKVMKPKRAESEKLLLKRWADQYFN